MAPSARWKTLQLRWPARCAVCKLELEAGAAARWYAAERAATCPECALPTPLVDEGTAGASGNREYDRLRQRREDHARQKLGRLGVFLARIIDEPQSMTAWKRGAEGEIRAGARLTKLLDGSGVRLLHDRRMPGKSRGNIDHIAVGPRGITVVDTKNYQGKVRVERIGGLFSERGSVLTIAGRDRTKLIDGVERQIGALHTLLRAHDREMENVDVRGALCFANVDGLPLLHRQGVRDVLIDGTRATAKLARRPGTLTPELIDALLSHLAVSLPPA